MSDHPNPTQRKRRLGVLAAAGIAVVALIATMTSACSAQTPTTPDPTTPKGSIGGKPIVIGVVGASEPYWATFKQAATDAGINVDIKDFTDYSLVNPALSSGDIDLNQFQHIIFLAQYIHDSGKQLTPIGATAIYPLGLYSKKYTSVDQIPAGSTVTVPNDLTNQARALLVLQSAGLIKLKSGGTIFSDLTDIDTTASKVKITAIDANLTPSSLSDAAAAIINNDFITDAGLTYADAIAKDDPSDPNALPYVNIWVSRPEDANNATYLKLVSIYQDTKAVTDGVQDASGGTAIFMKTAEADLQASLNKVLDDMNTH